ncbi:MAG: glycosyltransferase family 2 protein [Patescibacteria group bacterium]
MPKVSVIIPTYNRPEFIDKAIDSVLQQTYQDFEIIVVDDGVDKRADQVVSSFDDQRVRYIPHKENKGGAAARNTGIKEAQGEYIAFLDDDDTWVSEKLETQIQTLEQLSSEVGFCYCAVTQIRDEGNITSQVDSGIHDVYELALTRFKGFLTSGLMIRKSVLDEVGGFDPDLPSHQEPDLIIRMAKKYQGVGINNSLVTQYVKSDHEHIGGSLKRRIKGREMILEKYMGEFKQRPKVLAKHYFQLGLWHRDSDQKRKARQYMKKSYIKRFRMRTFLHYLRLFI